MPGHVRHFIEWGGGGGAVTLRVGIMSNFLLTLNTKDPMEHVKALPETLIANPRAARASPLSTITCVMLSLVAARSRPRVSSEAER